MKHTGLWYGGDYYPEQWLSKPEILKTDINYMKKAGINTVTMGIFSWSFLEPEEGTYCFDWLIKRVDELYENGINTILATPSGARPKWMSDQYPEVLRVDEARRRHLFGGRHNHCYTSPVYREKVRQINKRLAETFGSHPGILMWHISNEYGGECHCQLCQNEFQRWLKKRYQSITRLNECWYTAFWSHIYSSFEQIESPSSMGESEIHGLNLDWRRFVTEQTTDFATWEVKALREGGAFQPTTTNLMYDFTGLNYDRLTDAVDVVSWDTYPLWHKKEEILTARENGLQHDYMRSLKKSPFLLMESSPSSTNWQGVSKLKRPGLLKLASLQAIAHGSDSVLFFQIRQSCGSSEKFHGAVIDHYGGEDTRILKEVSQIGEDLLSLGELANTSVHSKMALICDMESRWAMEDAQGPRNKGLFYHETCVKIYRGMRKLGFDVDVISMEQSLAGYELVAAPMLYMFRNGIEEKLSRFVEAGGQLITTYWSGIVDEFDRCFMGAVPHGLNQVLGLRSMEIDGLYDEERNGMIPSNDSKKKGRYECRNLCDLVSLNGAKALFVYEEDFYKGYPALTKNHWGKGTAYYVCADASQEFYDDLFQEVTVTAGIAPEFPGTIPEELEVTTRESEDFHYVFLQNFSNNKIKLCQEFYMAVKKGSLVYGTFTENGGMNGYETIIVKFARSSQKQT
ncbi:beta-galactosidase [Clostridium sp. E02]|uniref:beta-galactosidase n=1 Tax=Clostridium sp. E02 TaxID=2487134 RepID=UPI000F52F5BC|nr:beta-galactosidase [Clostridium sp. E02]